MHTTRTRVGIVGAGPAGLLLSQLLHREGIESVIVEARSREAIEATIRAGVLEHPTVELLTSLGAGERMRREGFAHRGFELRFGGQGRRIDLEALTGGRSIMVYPQHEVLKDLVALRLATGGSIEFEARATGIPDPLADRPEIRYVSRGGTPATLVCDFVVGCDGGHSIGRRAIPEGVRTDHARVYPFAWFGILAEAPPSSDELVYAHSPRGFALISTRSPTVQRMYFQCDPADSTGNWSDDRIWAELQARVAGDGFRLREGTIFQKDIIPLRSFVTEPMRHGRLFLAGDAAHIVPPTGAKGLNLAAADVHVLSRALAAFYATGSSALLDAYSATALRRVWRTQHFSWWMTALLHRLDDASPFDVKRQLGELDLVTSSQAAAAALAEMYVGTPFA